MLTLGERASPATPAAGYSSFYPKADGLWYFKDDAGVEHQFSADAVLKALFTTKGDIAVATAAGVVTRLGVSADGQVIISDSSQASGIRWGMPPQPSWGISKLIQSNNVVDAVNDIDILAGSARDMTDTDNMVLAATITKQLDVAWAVGTNVGGLDTGAVADAEYYIWLIKRTDTGVVDVLFSLKSGGADGNPTMPANYTLKRLIGWIKRSAATIVAFKAYETEGGGLTLMWNVPTAELAISNTLTTSRRLDAMKVPRNFSTIAIIEVNANDAGSGFTIHICCPDQSDVVVSSTVAPFGLLRTGVAGDIGGLFQIRTSAAGLIASRSDLATVDGYRISTQGFHWARRN